MGVQLLLSEKPSKYTAYFSLILMVAIAHIIQENLMWTSYIPFIKVVNLVLSLSLCVSAVPSLLCRHIRSEPASWTHATVFDHWVHSTGKYYMYVCTLTSALYMQIVCTPSVLCKGEDSQFPIVVSLGGEFLFIVFQLWVWSVCSVSSCNSDTSEQCCYRFGDHFPWFKVYI